MIIHVSDYMNQLLNTEIELKNVYTIIFGDILNDSGFGFNLQGFAIHSIR